MSNVETKETDAVEFLRCKAPSLLREKAGGNNWGMVLADVGTGHYVFTTHDVFTIRSHEFVPLFGFAILDSETVDCLAQFGPLLEIGAGTGYWTYELQKAGVDIIATDIEPTDQNHYKFTKFWVPVEQLDGVAAVEKYPGRSLLIVWPDYTATWSADVLKAYKGDRVIYVGEGGGGCTACDEFHDYLDEHFILTDELGLYQFSGIHDRLEIWERRETDDEDERRRRSE
jgi:hypothetical protein